MNFPRNQNPSALMYRITHNFIHVQFRAVNPLIYSQIENYSLAYFSSLLSLQSALDVINNESNSI